MNAACSAEIALASCGASPCYRQLQRGPTLSTADLSPNVVLKLKILQEKLGADDLDTALSNSLDIANFVTDTIHDPSRKLLVEHDGKYKIYEKIL